MNRMKSRRHGPPLLIRPADALLPLALLIASLAGHGEGAKSLYKFTLFTRMLALGSAVGLRCAFSAQPSMRLARGSARLALGLQVVGGGVAALIWAFRGELSPWKLFMTVAGIGVNIEAVFYEYLRAAGEERSAALLHAITAALILGGTLTAVPDAPPVYLLTGSLISAAVGGVVAATIADGLGRAKYSIDLLRYTPRALLYCGLYPLTWVLLRRVPGLWVAESPTFAPLFVGLIPWLLWRTPFRRSALEARPMNRAAAVTLAACAAIVALCALPALSSLAPELPAAAVMAAAATLCALAVFSRIEWPGKTENN